MQVRQRSVHPDFDHRSASGVGRWALPPKQKFYRRAAKRWLDIAFVLAALPIVLPVVLVLAAAIKLGGSSPFYRQERLGLGGRTFTLWKLRTMVEDADVRLGEYLAKHDGARQEWDAYQKLSHDPRITELGNFLRKSSLDELPQLWNVLKGDMSLVGPRPMMPEQRPLYPGHAYYSLLPGVTGLWQVSDRNGSTFAQRAEFDAAYDMDVSLATDLRVLFATVGVVLRGTGK